MGSPSRRLERRPHVPPVFLAAACAWLVCLSLLAGCGGEEGAGYGNSFDPPSLPAHDDSEDGFMHAAGKSSPFLCRDDSGREEACPDDVWPAPQNLSCDASGCHGTYEYSPEQPWADRDLEGSDGPSCYTCHGREWSERMD